MDDQWNHKMFNEATGNFDRLAMEAFQYQYAYNPVYRGYADAVHKHPGRVKIPADIPFLPIRFFRSHAIKTGSFETEHIFESSGTTGSINSRHYIRDISLYEASFMNAFHSWYRPVTDWCIIGLLPSYLERSNASLVYMVNSLIRESGHQQSGFYLNEYNTLSQLLQDLEAKSQPVLLIGVTFALLDFAASHPMPLKHTTIMETGGMKGRRREMIRAEVHDILKSAFGIHAIHSEYGMTELLSQAYSHGKGLFKTPPWMKIMLRDEEDPLMIKTSPGVNVQPVAGVINIIDLANIHSCCFIATDDVGRVHPDSSFEVLGRMDNSDLRGCSLMVV